MGTNQRAAITMTDAEIVDFIERSRTVTMATNGPTGRPHLVAMWYAVLDGKIWIETKAKSQKVKNLQRDDSITCMIEDGLTYDQLRGVALEGRGVVSDDPDQIWAVGVNVFERYNGPYSEEMKPFVEAMMNKRIVVRLEVDRVRSWDHRKLGMGAMPIAGTTAQYL